MSGRGRKAHSDDATDGTDRFDRANAVADRAIDILLSFSDDEPVLRAVDICERFDMSRSTVYRYLMSLRSRGLVVEEASGGFRLGPKLFELARVARHGTSIVHIAEEGLQELCSRSGEMVLLTQRVDQELIPISVIESRQRIGITYVRGQMLAGPAGASAKVFLANFSNDHLETVLNNLKLQPYTGKSVTDVATLRNQLKEVRERGYAFNDEELDEGIRAIAAPVHTRRGVQFTVSIVGPIFRITDEKIEALAGMVVGTADALTQRLRDYGF